MKHFLGEFEVKLDAKKRLMLPMPLKKQLVDTDRFVINRAFDACLNLYPFDVWEEVDHELTKLNPFVKKERDFIRFVRGGATEVTLDAQGRFILPSRLMSYANIDSDIVLSGNGSLIEIWDQATYDQALNVDSESFSTLAEEVMVKYEKDALFDFDERIVVPIMRR
ncbi:division/cell wall cluster transcriptional repressor MraZ [Wohlfahrtiimonas chitiniclastica]|uniref:division/cell wall cluster transcriptional repressor MraZ n=1 Tax=Wohlfahrtiimonas chitiniclastica TaxID=400946 RepID=UPI000B9875C8|nr:division/cell wall cluster transcriptional repressor MraZ [Wohlfahrtiimonas chitiniclastica]OYQ79898.1 division/cell wall cluster transcriptional repressor MraZ [Wohlfahrtiimonas chitiniclastica]